MGIVYEAEQERPHRHVALKIMRPGLVPSPVLRRFELEYEFLGRLQHPGIAQIYQALRDLPSTPPPRHRAALERLAAFYVAAGRPAEATPWRNRLHAFDASRRAETPAGR